MNRFNRLIKCQYKLYTNRRGGDNQEVTIFYSPVFVPHYPLVLPL